MGKSRTNAGRRISSRPRTYKHLVLAFVVVASFAVFKWLMHDSEVMEWLRQQGFLALHKSLGLNAVVWRPPVLIVDLSHIGRNPEALYATNSPLKDLVRGKTFIDRAKLSALIKRVASFQPAAIAIDVDLSPELDGTEPPAGHFELLQACHRLSSDGVPVFCGVGRTAGMEPEVWLGVKEYKNIAALGLRFPGNNALVPSAIRRDDDGLTLPSISRCLADQYSHVHGKPPQVPECLDWAVAPDREVTLPNVHGWHIRAFHVNYHFIGVMTNETLGWLPAETILNSEEGSPEERSLGERFKGKAVILGDARFHETFDTAYAPGQAEPVPGVFIHAAAACTLINSPLTEVNLWSGLFLGFGISALFILLREKFAQKYASSMYAVTGEFVINGLAIIVAVLLAFFLAVLLHILWLDVVAACAVFCFEFYAMVLLLANHRPKHYEH